MACTVYCLVPHPEQLDTVVERLKGAGVETRDVAVVPRQDWRWPCKLCASPPPAWTEMERVLPDIWNLPFALTSLWWEWSVRSYPQTASSAGPEAGSPCIIPLAQYEATLKATLMAPDKT